MRRWQRLRGKLQPRRAAALVVVVALALSVGLSACGDGQAGTLSGEESGSFKARGVQGTGF